MTTPFFECSYEGERFIGFADAPEGEPLLLFPAPADTAVALLDAAGSGDAFAAAVRGDGAGRLVPASAREAVRPRPPVLPVAPGSAVAGGFMQTHNVKAAAEGAADGTAHPNWFFKGFGDALRVPGEPLSVPAGAVAVCEEAEVVLVYRCGDDGTPAYLGYTFGNDLTDIGRFRENPAHLSYAKLCEASVSPWFFPGAPPRAVTGHVTVERAGQPAWEGEFKTGLDALYYPVESMTGHLFAYPPLRRPGTVHYVFLGADRSSFHAGFRIGDGDVVSLDFTSHGVTVANSVHWLQAGGAA
ncbi:FAH family protein [Streptomyces sp. ISL-86]|uniref:FAH family protein n=1 Tax=Streptomyces sp. ISL-86 TaxID=2819187 RepID=UPI001BE88D98|nr:FAH family protein [Streptomyces sp. ISL-86]MBT2459029.1 FAH family protein [Streptomyces sp. ISL-86]